ncbi:mediator of RNA polymerase II transcription subunit 18-like [Sycon ciliatum]|uniref:mediator of RNA polymerase II transcription subunit 18-like n=1 Tax=Sycon ciliatum TaxID=27933 RepID=UPI0020A8BC0A|eukprot:scpid40507/ scgid25775/ Mediator of RNA polymerase II transcription subunit 18; Mediator complex subunit 18
MTDQRYEYLLQGSVSEDVLPQLVTRLRCITDQTFEGGNDILVHERIYMLKGTGSASVTVYCRRSLQEDPPVFELRYLGVPETTTGQSGQGQGSARKPVSMRSCAISSVDSNCFKFLEDLGFRKCNEHVLKGYYFLKNNVGVSVVQVYTLDAAGKQSAAPVSASSLVTARLIAGSGSVSAIDLLWSVADMLKPLVALAKAS